MAQGAPGEGDAGAPPSSGNDPEFEVDRPAHTDGQLDLRFNLLNQPAQALPQAQELLPLCQ